ncbi:MAG: hypothetical protein P4L16_06345 [Chlamydiales bacterium]|nr:hypothetical protein [Chlamydiales bacterium]
MKKKPLLDFLRNYICLLKISILTSKANYARGLFFYSILSVFVISLFLLATLFYVTNEDALLYQDLMKKHYMSSNRSSFLNTKQKRSVVHKEIWLTKENSRHKIDIESPYSEIVIVNQAHTSTIQEKLKNANLVIQEKLYFNLDKPMQEIRHLSAEEATFSYQDRLFIASNVALSSFSCPGHSLPKKLNSEFLTMKGQASKVYFNVDQTTFDLNAKDLKANFFPTKDAL